MAGEADGGGSMARLKTRNTSGNARNRSLPMLPPMVKGRRLSTGSRADAPAGQQERRPATAEKREGQERKAGGESQDATPARGSAHAGGIEGVLGT